MLSKKMIEKLNDHIQYELYSGHLYLSLAAYCASKDLDGFTNFFIVQEQEERFHAMKFFNYLNIQGAEINILGLEDPKSNFQNLEDVFDFSWKHEQSVTQRLNKLIAFAIEENDFATQNFLQWFICEQVEEEASILGILNKIKLIDGEGHGLLMLDNELATRKFTPPTAN